MKQNLFLIFIIALISLSACKDEKEDEQPASVHAVTIYNHPQPDTKAPLASVAYGGDIMQYCGDTDENGEPEAVRSISFKLGGNDALSHYILDDQGRVVLAYNSIEGENQSEVHKLRYGSLDSVYYAIHQFNWDNGVNVLDYEVAFALWGDEYLGTTLYAKSGEDLIESSNQSLTLFAELAALVEEHLEEEDYSSIHALQSPRLKNMVNWSAPTISTAEVGETAPFTCYTFDNAPNPNGSPDNPTGTQDMCFNVDMTVDVDYELDWNGWVMNVNVAGGNPPYFISVNGGSFTFSEYAVPLPEPGPVTIDVIDNQGCTSSVIIVGQDMCADSDLSVSATPGPGQATAEATGGTEPYLYRWFSGETHVASGAVQSTLAEGTYTCKVIDANFCEATTEVTVGSKCAGQTTVTDVDGNTYPVVEIEGQCWMAENMRTTKYNTGSNIQHITTESLWENTNAGARTAYNNDPANVETYGYLYNRMAAINPNFCPTGWHLPSADEFEYLIESAGGSQVAGIALKSPDLWASVSGGSPGSNTTGFSALPAGRREGEGYSPDFQFIGIVTDFWSSDISQTYNRPQSLSLTAGSNGASVQAVHEANTGKSVRCLKD